VRLDPNRPNTSYLLGLFRLWHHPFGHCWSCFLRSPFRLTPVSFYLFPPSALGLEPLFYECPIILFQFLGAVSGLNYEREHAVPRVSLTPLSNAPSLLPQVYFSSRPLISSSGISSFPPAVFLLFSSLLFPSPRPPPPCYALQLSLSFHRQESRKGMSHPLIPYRCRW